YKPYASRGVRIPKCSGKGFRTLHIRNIADRVVAAALSQALTPFWEARFLPGCMGFRPGKGVWHALARLEGAMMTENRWVLAQDDIANAFDHVNINDVLEDHRRNLEDAGLLGL